MKYSERFFEFPIRIYDRYTAENAAILEKSSNSPMEGDWARGFAKVPYDEINSWTDYYDSIQGVEGVKADGFQYILVFTWNMGVFISTWTKAQFEAKLDAYADKYEKWREGEIDFLLKRLADLAPQEGPNEQL